MVVHTHSAPVCEARLNAQADSSKHGSNSNNETLPTEDFSITINVRFTQRLPVSFTYGGAHLQMTVTHLELGYEVCLLDSLVLLQEMTASPPAHHSFTCYLDVYTENSR